MTVITLGNLAALGSGSLVGFVLGLIGGGGSVLAVPLLVYVVGVSTPHIAIGTSAVAVAASAFANVLGHARAGNVRWPCAFVFTISGVIGAGLGSTLGKSIGGQKLLVLFGFLMIAIAMNMLMKRGAGGEEFRPLGVDTAPALAPRLVGMGLAIGVLSGFFGIGGGFLVVPGLMKAARMPMLMAIGTSLVSVTAFGLTTAIFYASSGLVDWRLAIIFVLGGILGGILGGRLAKSLASRNAFLTQTFAAIVMAVGIYVIGRGFPALTG